MGLHKDQEIEPKELEKLKKNSQIGKAYDRTIRLISMRPRSQWEIEDYLKRKGYDEDVTRSVLAKLAKLELVDDTKFAQQWVQWRLNSSNRSRRQLYAELLQKRIDRELIEEVLAELDPETELAQIRALIERKARQYPDRQKLMAFLARKGFSYDLIKQALSGE